MDLYLLLFVLGAAGLLVMAISGLGRHGADGAGHAGAHAGAHTGAHAAVHAALPGGGGAGHVLGAARGPGRGHASSQVPNALRGGAGVRDVLLALASPRVLFSVALGAGATGLLLGGALAEVLGGVPLAVLAVAGGVLLERLAVAPVWRGVERFASRPARTLDSALFDEARAASGFDANGEGLVALELDGQVVQLLGRLRAPELGTRVRAGDRLRVEDVDTARNRCTVSLHGSASG